MSNLKEYLLDDGLMFEFQVYLLNFKAILRKFLLFSEIDVKICCGGSAPAPPVEIPLQ
jgi:hypothetical protein